MKIIYPEIGSEITDDIDNNKSISRKKIRLLTYIRIKREEKYYLILVITNFVCSTINLESGLVKAFERFLKTVYKTQQLYKVDEGLINYMGKKINLLDKDQTPEEERIMKLIKEGKI